MGCVASVVLALMLFQQVPRQRQRGQQPPAAAQGGNPDAIATIYGMFKSADKKYLMIEVEGGQSMRMYLTGKTKFVREGKPAKAADFKTDENVAVDAERDTLLNLIAVRVEAVPAKTPERPPEK
jgi:crotonobetainyl-CoA:carnitine CoA-transferase CaiB-like acyl-CoA transferase